MLPLLPVKATQRSGAPNRSAIVERHLCQKERGPRLSGTRPSRPGAIRIDTISLAPVETSLGLSVGHTELDAITSPVGLRSLATQYDSARKSPSKGTRLRREFSLSSLKTTASTLMARAGEDSYLPFPTMHGRCLAPRPPAHPSQDSVFRAMIRRLRQ
jgi:hypothetical protein